MEKSAKYQHGLYDKLRKLYDQAYKWWQNKDSKDELIIFLVIINIMLTLLLLNFYFNET